jgi:histidyl-tRNA synthetase
VPRNEPGGARQRAANSAAAASSWAASPSRRRPTADRLGRPCCRAAGREVRVDLGLLHASEFHDTTALLFRSAGDHQVLGDGGSYGLFARAFLEDDVGVQCAVVGLERIADLVSQSRPVPTAAPEFAVLIHGSSRLADHVCTTLRTMGISVWDQVISQPLAHHLRNLATLGISASTIIGERERDDRPLQVRRIDGTIVPVMAADLPSWLLARRTACGAR